MTQSFEKTDLIMTHMEKNNDLGPFSCVFGRKSNILKAFTSTFTSILIFKQVTSKISNSLKFYF